MDLPSLLPNQNPQSLVRLLLLTTSYLASYPKINMSVNKKEYQSIEQEEMYITYSMQDKMAMTVI